jgi:hypothetical protein
MLSRLRRITSTLLKSGYGAAIIGAAGINNLFSTTLGRRIIATPESHALHNSNLEIIIDPVLGLALTRGLIGGAITGALSGPFLFDCEHTRAGIDFHWSDMAKQLFPIVPMIFPFVSDIIGDAIMAHTTCYTTSHGQQYCIDDSSFVTRSASASIAGYAILAPSVTLVGYMGYKLREWCHRHRDEPVATAALPPPRTLELRQRLDSCYSGEIPEIFLDPIHKELMNNPIMLRCGHNYDEEHLAELKTNCSECSLCRAPFNEDDFAHPATNIVLKGQIIEFVEGKERAIETMTIHIVTLQDEEKANLDATPVLIHEEIEEISRSDRDYELKSPATNSIFYRAPTPRLEPVNLENSDAPYWRLDL